MNSFNYFREIIDTINYGINEMNNLLDKGPSIDRKAIESDWKKIVNF